MAPPPDATSLNVVDPESVTIALAPAPAVPATGNPDTVVGVSLEYKDDECIVAVDCDADMLPVTISEVSVPTEVIFGCAAVVTVAAVAAEPLTEPVIAAVTVRADSVPTDVMLGCAAVVTVAALVARAAGAKYDPPAPLSIRLPSNCTVDFLVSGVPFMSTTATKSL